MSNEQPANGVRVRRPRVPAAFAFAAFCATLACCAAIGIFVWNEYQYDRFHVHAREGRLYRLTLREIESRGTDIRGGLTPPQMGPTLAKEFPDLIEAVARCRRKDTDIQYGSPIVSSSRLARSEPRFYWADPTFFDVFTVPFIQGDPRTALARPDTIVITESIAKAYFGDENPIGRKLSVDGTANFVVTAIAADPPANTHLHADLMASMLSEDDSRATYWIKNNYYTYVVLKPGVTPEAVQMRIDYLMARDFDADLRKWLGFSLGDMARSGNKIWFYPHPVRDIHLTPHDFEAERYGNLLVVRLLAWGAMAFFVAAILGFGNVLHAIGRDAGAGRAFVEACAYGAAAVVVVLPLTIALLPLTSALRSDGRLLSAWQPAWILPAVAASVAGAAILSAAVRLALRAMAAARVRRVRVVWTAVNGLVTAAALVAAVAIGRQVHHLATKPLGMTRDPIVVLNEMDTLGDRMADFKADLRSSPAIAAVSDSATLPGRQFRGKSHSLRLDAAAGDFLTLWQVTTDEGFADTYGLRMKEGRFFTTRPEDAQGAVINETAARLLGLHLGTTLYEHAPGTPYKFTVIGIVEDFQVGTMRKAIPPVTIKLLRYQPKRVGRFIAVRPLAGQLDAAVAHIDAVWKKRLPGRAIETMLFSDDYGKLLAPEIATASIVAGVAALSVSSLFGALFALGPARRWRLSVFMTMVSIAGSLVGYLSAQRWLAGFHDRLPFASWISLVVVAAIVAAAWAMTRRGAAAADADRAVASSPEWQSSTVPS